MPLPVLSKFTATLSSAIPIAAAAQGYNLRTLGPNVTIGSNWQYWNFFSSPATTAVQNGDGTVQLPGADPYNGGLATAYNQGGKLNSWAGIAFGGGMYVEFIAKYTMIAGPTSGLGGGWPALWLMNIEHLCGITSFAQWPGQAAGYQHWMEWDVMEADEGSTVDKWGSSRHDWYRDTTPATHQTNFGSGLTVQTGLTTTVYNKWGFLLIPSTSTTNGSGSFYLNDVLTTSQSWVQTNLATVTPPAVAGTSAMSLSDSCHFVPIIGNGATVGIGVSVQVQSVSVWQATNANNLIQ